MKKTRRLALGLVLSAIASVVSACTEREFSLPPASRPGHALIAAWDEGDFARMTTLFSRSSRRRWKRARLEHVMDRLTAQGRITDFEVAPTGPVREPDISSPEELERAPTVVAGVPYRLAYRSLAARRPVVFRGTVRLRFDRSEQRWRAIWSRSLFLPGIRRAAGFRVTERWPRRAPILDRAGRVLARGRAASRRYPYVEVAGSTVGHIGTLDARETRALPSFYRAGDLAGASGLEEAFERRLAGTPSLRLLAVDGRGRPLEMLGRRAGRPGRRITATLDVEVQRAAEAAFGKTVGGAVVSDPATGDLLAVVSSSRFDPNVYVGADDVEPFNRALSGLYPPGSAMKIVTASAALDSGEFTPQSTVTGPKEYKGVVNFESGKFGLIPFSDALRFSVNTAFAQVAEKLGPSTLTRYARAFGFNRDPRLRMSTARSSFPFPSQLWELMWAAIGQAEVVATPMQMATVAATIANGGKRMEPRAAVIMPRLGHRAVSRRTARQMKTMMQSVVRSGTGVAAQVPGVDVAGKTGTAEVDVNGVRKNHAWFIAFAPAEDPKVALALVSEYGGVGGRVAAPIARRILERVLPLVD